MELDRFKTLKRTTLLWLPKSCVLDSTRYLRLCQKLYLTIGVSIARCKRSFSKLKIIKSYLLSTMSDDRLSGLSILFIEKDYDQKLDFEDINADFASAKARKVQF